MWRPDSDSIRAQEGASAALGSERERADTSSWRHTPYCGQFQATPTRARKPAVRAPAPRNACRRALRADSAGRSISAERERASGQFMCAGSMHIYLYTYNRFGPAASCLRVARADKFGEGKRRIVTRARSVARRRRARPLRLAPHAKPALPSSTRLRLIFVRAGSARLFIRARGSAGVLYHSGHRNELLCERRSCERASPVELAAFGSIQVSRAGASRAAS